MKHTGQVGLVATYRMVGSADTIEAQARKLCIEQTVEVTEPLCQEEFIARHVVAQVLSITSVSAERFDVVVAYETDVLTEEIPQMVNVLYGNISLGTGVRLIHAMPSKEYAAMLKGPRLGIQGVRQVCQVQGRPLLVSALKPMGRPVSQFAKDAWAMAAGGIDLIKDDHGVNNQPFHPFEERVEACCRAIALANEETGKNATYLPTLMGPLQTMLSRARFAKDAGAGGFLVAPMLAGFDAMRALADETGLMVMSHPAMLGVFGSHPDHGIAYGMLYGTLMRLMGADLVVFPSWGGRFPLTREDNADIAKACIQDLSGLPPTLPVPAGGLTLARVNNMKELFGKDMGLLIGSDLYEQSDDLVKNAEYFLSLVQR